MHARIRRGGLLWIVFAGMAWSAVAAEVFKWYDDAGNVYYGDSPPAEVRVHSIDAATVSAVPMRDIVPPAPTVLVYSTQTCPACKKAKAWLRDRDVAFQERDVERSAQYRREFRQLGGKGVPLIRVGDRLMTGFSPQRLRELVQP